MQNSIEFKSIDELYKRVKPALYSKVKEIRNAGYKFVNEKDIWDYLVKNEWKKRNDLELNDLINDILYVDSFRINEYVMNKMKEIKNKISNEDSVL